MVAALSRYLPRLRLWSENGEWGELQVVPVMFRAPQLCRLSDRFSSAWPFFEHGGQVVGKDDLPKDSEGCSYPSLRGYTFPRWCQDPPLPGADITGAALNRPPMRGRDA